MARTDPQINIRMPAELKEKLERATADSGRSLTAEIVKRLEESFIETDAHKTLSLIGAMGSILIFGQPDVREHALEDMTKEQYAEAIENAAMRVIHGARDGTLPDIMSNFRSRNRKQRK